MKYILLTVLILASGCSSHAISVRLPLPPKPLVPKIINSDLICISDDAYEILVKRDIAHKHYEQRLESVIKSTW